MRRLPPAAFVLLAIALAVSCAQWATVVDQSAPVKRDLDAALAFEQEDHPPAEITQRWTDFAERWADRSEFGALAHERVLYWQQVEERVDQAEQKWPEIRLLASESAAPVLNRFRAAANFYGSTPSQWTKRAEAFSFVYQLGQQAIRESQTAHPRSRQQGEGRTRFEPQIFEALRFSFDGLVLAERRSAALLRVYVSLVECDGATKPETTGWCDSDYLTLRFEPYDEMAELIERLRQIDLRFPADLDGFFPASDLDYWDRFVMYVYPWERSPLASVMQNTMRRITPRLRSDAAYRQDLARRTMPYLVRVMGRDNVKNLLRLFGEAVERYAAIQNLPYIQNCIKIDEPMSRPEWARKGGSDPNGAGEVLYRGCVTDEYRDEPSLVRFVHRRVRSGMTLTELREISAMLQREFMSVR